MDVWEMGFEGQKVVELAQDGVLWYPVILTVCGLCVLSIDT